MGWIIYHVGGGHALFVGIGLLMLASAASNSSSKLFRRQTRLLFLIGLIAVAVSSAPFPLWLWIVVGVASLIGLVGFYWEKHRTKGTRIFVAAWLFALVMEAPYHLLPTIEAAKDNTMMIVADSVTAGQGSNDRTTKWPVLFAKDYNVTVDDQSNPGERCSTALKHLADHKITSSVVFLEIGGNDLTGSTSNEKFAADLEALLKRVSGKDRQLIMFELPLVPFRNQYGMVQRRLARKYGVTLIPKRVFVSVLAPADNTTDLIHLTQAGHNQMAKTVGDCLKDVFK